MLTTVTSRWADFLAFQEINVSPSGHVPSVLESLVGSTFAGISARFKARQTKSLILICLAFFPEFDLHDNPWKPSMSSTARTLVCFTLCRAKATATRISSLSRRKPHDEMGRALSQSLLYDADTASRRALQTY